METPQRTHGVFRLNLLALAALIVLVPCLGAWLVNLEEALSTVDLLQAPLLPEDMRRWFLPFAVDLSTISTLVPVLLFLYPLIVSLRVARLKRTDPSRIPTLIYDPYPPHFSFFLVMLGLAGTLYGLYIGLDISGVAKLGESLPTPEAIQETLDRLLDGTATALLSSLFGLIGAFVAARPLTWLFQWAAGYGGEEEPISLTQTLTHLNRELNGLEQSARAFREQLGLQDAGKLTDQLDRIDNRVEAVQSAHERLGGQVGELVEGQRETTQLLSRLLEQQENHARDMREVQLQSVSAQQASLDELKQLTDTAGAARERSDADRSALKKALGALIDRSSGE